VRLGRRQPQPPQQGTRLGVRLPSGRSLPAGVERLEPDGVLVLDVPATTSLRPGTPVELRWSDGSDWCSQRFLADTPAIAGGERRLRLRPAGPPELHRDRRGDERREPVLVVLVRVVRSAEVMPGEQERAWLADLSPAGLSFESELAFEEGDRLEVTALGAAGSRIATVPATVVRCQRAPGALDYRVAVRLDGGEGFEDAVRKAGA
jgi:hypothetical protein